VRGVPAGKGDGRYAKQPALVLAIYWRSSPGAEESLSHPVGLARYRRATRW